MSKNVQIDRVRPSRRAVVHGAAWSVPVVAVAATAPAYAASCGVVETLNWSSYSNGTVFSSAQFDGNTLSISQSGNLGPDSGKVIYQPEGGYNPALRFYPANNVNGSSVTVTVTFTRPVKDLTFEILDIDNSRDGNTWYWRDRVEILTTPFTGTKGSRVEGNGTNASPYQNTTNTALDNSSPNGNVTLKWAGPLTTVSFRYYQVGSPTGTPHTGLSPISFTTVC
jgi:hypothetical protein